MTPFTSDFGTSTTIAVIMFTTFFGADPAYLFTDNEEIVGNFGSALSESHHQQAVVEGLAIEAVTEKSLL